MVVATVSAALVVFAIPFFHGSASPRTSDMPKFPGAPTTVFVPPPTRITFPSPDAKLKFNYRVPGYVPLVRQSKAKACWAAATAIMFGWKFDGDVSVEDALDAIGPVWRANYNQGETRGLRRQEKEDFLKAATLTFEYGASYAVEGLRDLLVRYGPLWFTVDNEFNTHATVVIGLFGSGAMEDTYVVYVDPADGSEHRKPYAEYMRWYEGVAVRENKDLDEDPRATSSIQVVHFKTPEKVTRP